MNKKIIKLHESDLVKIISKVIYEQETEQQKKFNKEVLNFAQEVEVLKQQKGAGGKWDSYNKKGVTTCEPCKLTVTGTLQGDINSKSYCVNKKIYEGQGWDCPEGYSLYSVLSKEYQISSISNENQDKVLNLVSKLPTYKWEDPMTKVGRAVADAVKWLAEFVYENRHELLMLVSIGALFIPVVGPLLSLSADLADTALYVGEKEYYTAGLTAIFALVPGNQLLKKFINKNPQFVNKLSKMLKLSESGQVTKKYIMENFNQNELEWIKNIQENASKLTYDAAKNASIQAARNILPKTKLGVLINWYKKYPTVTSILGQGITLGGIWYSWSKLSKMWGVSNETDRKLETQYNEKSKKEMMDVATENVAKQLDTPEQAKIQAKHMANLAKMIEKNNKLNKK
jgi:hypothetical protein